MARYIHYHLLAALYDSFPVSPGHALVVTTFSFFFAGIYPVLSDSFVAKSARRLRISARGNRQRG
jgi:hypothetical protein